MPTYRLTIEYDGTDWHGWQSQPESPTIQTAIEEALQTAMRIRVPVVGSGRTDAGVHARGQVAHMRTEQIVDTVRLTNSLNGILPPSIAVTRIDSERDGFHARYDARLRSYAYTICTVPTALFPRYQWYVRPRPDFKLMNEAGSLLLGSHDFSSFCKSASAAKNRICTVTRSQWVRGASQDSWVFRITADRFLHGMVRAIVGTLVEVGHGKRNPDSLNRLLTARDRSEAGRAAPALGLVLEHVEY